MKQNDGNNEEQTSDNGSPANADQIDEKQTGEKTGKIPEIEKKLAGASAILKKEAKIVTAEAEDLLKHPKRCAELGASVGESLAAGSVGEVIGGAIGTMFGPEGTVIGAEMGSIAGQVLGARHGDQLAKKLLHDTGKEAPIQEDVERISGLEASGKTGKKIGGIIGDALFDDAGAEIGEMVGSAVGELAGEIAYEQVKKKHHKKEAEPSSEDEPQTKSNNSKK